MIYRVKINSNTYETKRYLDSFLENSKVLTEDSVEYKKLKQNRGLYRNFRNIMKFLNKKDYNYQTDLNLVLKEINSLDELPYFFNLFVDKISSIEEFSTDYQYLDVLKKLEQNISKKDYNYPTIFLIAYLDNLFQKHFSPLSSQKLEEFFKNTFLESKENSFLLNFQIDIDKKSIDFQKIWFDRLKIAFQYFWESKHLCFDCQRVKGLNCLKVKSPTKFSIDRFPFIENGVQEVVTKEDNLNYPLYKGEFIKTFIVSECEDFISELSQKRETGISLIKKAN
ncbi:MAG: hypothetical protein GX641_01830 [Mollicutes bacterium]|nr:hypothetical protein [Mollicutes bacterium]